MANFAPEPDLSLLMGGMGAPPPEEPEDTPETILRRMIEDAKLYLEVEQDEEDRLTMTEVLRRLQSYLAAEQKERDALFGSSPVSRLLRRR